MPTPASSEPASGPLRIEAPLHEGRPGEPVVPGAAVLEAQELLWCGPLAELPPPLASATAGTVVPRPHALLTPTLMDHHVHGSHGMDAATSATADVLRWLEAQRAAGVDDVLLSLPSLRLEAAEAALARLEPAWAAGSLAGVHLEGPFLSPARAGAHPRDALLSPEDPAGRRVVDWVCSLPRGLVRTMTLAVELPGALRAAARLAEHGVLACPGHTDATAAQLTDAVEALRGPDAPGAAAAPEPVITHLFNAMRGFHHRDPGPVPAALAEASRARVRCELIADGHHVDPWLVERLLDPRAPWAGQVMVVSDAVAATGAERTAAGLQLGHAELDAGSGVPRVRRPGRRGQAPLAGGAGTLSSVVGGLLCRGLDPAGLIPAVTSVPRRTLGSAPTCADGWRRADRLLWEDGVPTPLRAAQP